MPITYIRTNPVPASIGTSRSLAVPTSPATFVVSLSGYMGWQWVNVGPSTLTYGDSNITVGTGGLLFYSTAKEWYPIADTMSLYVIATSVAGVLRVNDYL